MIPPWLETFAADLVDHIELGLEGDWSATVRTVWSRRTRGRRSVIVPELIANRRALPYPLR